MTKGLWGCRALAAVMLVALTAACSSDRKDDLLSANPNVFPANYKQEILATLTRTLDDPVNIKEAMIADPVLMQAGAEQRYVVCMRFNARSQSRNYMGVKDRAAYFYGGSLNQLVDAKPDQCSKAAYKPFPELEKLCQAAKCE